jgi:AhpD family alkylhydroperoxidase
MTARIDFRDVSPDAVRAVFGMEQYVRASDLDDGLANLVRMRVSFMNGCAYCIDMHSKDALLAGETPQRLLAVPVWRETPFFTERERLALEWAEALTAISPESVDDDLFERATAEFGESGLIDLTVAVAAINTWNRLAITFRTEPGSYQPAGRGDASA